MTTLCPTCNNALDRKYSKALKEDILACSVCQRCSLEGLSVWPTKVDIAQLRKLKAARDEERARWQLMMESPITHPMWTDISS